MEEVPRQDEPPLSVIIINWRSKEYLRTCLAGLRSVSAGRLPEVIVVDNASYDGCGEMLGREFPEVTFIQSERNLGFAKGNNLGAAKAAGRNVVFLNPDTEFTENSLAILVSRLESLSGAGAAGCTLLNTDKTVQTSCIQSFPTLVNQVLDCELLRAWFPRSPLWGTAPLTSTVQRPEPVDVVSGACLLVKRSAFEQVGGFTEAYFMYGEDMDLCYKLHRAGYLVYYVPDTRLVHHGGTSTLKARAEFSNVVAIESVYRFLRLNRGWASAAAYRLAIAAASAVRLLLIPPLLVAGRRIVRQGAASLSKWLAILRWSLGLESLSKYSNT